MRKFFTLTLLVCFFAWLPGIHAQKSSKTLTPVQFSDKMSDITDSLYKKGTAWGNYFNTAAQSGDYSSLAPYRKAVEDYVARSIKSLKVMPDVNNSQALRKAMIQFLEFEQKMVVEGFTPIEKLPANSSQADREKVLGKLQVMAKQEEVELKKVADVQEEYAKTNGFKIESEAGDE